MKHAAATQFTRVTPESDAIATVQFWILEGMSPAQVWEAMGKPTKYARSVTWPMVLSVVMAQAERDARGKGPA